MGIGAKLTASNLRRAWLYLKKNGLAATVGAALERLFSSYDGPYDYRPADEETLERQRLAVWEEPPLLSLAVPAYETGETQLRALLDSLLSQTYGHWELVLADASRTGAVRKVMDTYSDPRLRYLRLDKNAGIAANTNAAILAAKGAYIGLLDHDDFLSPDALYEMAKAARRALERGEPAALLYSDEDKVDEAGRVFSAPYRKPDFNESLLLSNNYICHFLMMERGMMQRLLERPEYEGAQDYDLILRAVSELSPSRIKHVPRVLYHWRCHEGSTAANPGSKRYAYEEGRRVVAQYCAKKGWDVRVVDTRHLGFYRVEYEEGVLAQRPEVGVVGGRLFRHGRLAAGMYEPDGTCAFAGLPKGYSGPFHQAILQQDAWAVDLRCVQVQPSLEASLAAYRDRASENGDWAACSIAFCQKAREAGYGILWDPLFLPQK